MKLVVVLLMMAGLVVGTNGVVHGEEKPKVVKALPPHPLDEVFKKEGANTVTTALINSKLYKKALEEAFKAKKATEAEMKKQTNYAGPSPEQAARAKFIKVLMNESEN